MLARPASQIMEADDTATCETAQQFWDALAHILSVRCSTHEEIDDALRLYLATASENKCESPSALTYGTSDLGLLDSFLTSSNDLARCCFELCGSGLFHSNRDYVRRQFIYSLLQVMQYQLRSLDTY